MKAHNTLFGFSSFVEQTLLQVIHFVCFLSKKFLAKFSKLNCGSGMEQTDNDPKRIDCIRTALNIIYIKILYSMIQTRNDHFVGNFKSFNRHGKQKKKQKHHFHAKKDGDSM
jgi:hypothetical protein